MALLLGTHQELIQSIRSWNDKALGLIKTRKYLVLLQTIFSGRLPFSLAGLIVGLLIVRLALIPYVTAYPIFISSFFFSLVSIAALLLLRKITRWSAGVVVAILFGIGATYLLSRMPPFSTPDHALAAFPAGFLAGSTFIIPGVSDAFILIIIGKYQYILASFGSLEFDVIILFICGGILGLGCTAHLFATLVTGYFNLAMGLFAGLMIGSLNKIWPWREVVEYVTTIEGKRIPAFDSSILPWRYLEITGKDPQIFYAILMMAAGVFMVVLIDKITSRLKTKS